MKHVGSLDLWKAIMNHIEGAQLCGAPIETEWPLIIKNSHL